MIQVRLSEAQQALHEMEVGGVHFTGDPEGALALVGFLGEKVSAGGLPETDLSGTGYLEGLFSPGVGFYLWHDEKINGLPCRRPCSGRELMEPCGIIGTRR